MMSQMTIGLDLGNDRIKRVRLRSTFRTVEILDYTVIPLPADDRPYAERLKLALTDLEGAEVDHLNDIVAASMPGQDISLRVIPMPFADPRRIAATIGLELERQIPLPLDKVVYDHMVVGLTDDGAQVMIALCPIDRMAEWLNGLAEAKLDPRLVGTDCLAYSSLFEFLPPIEPDASVAVVDIGHRYTSVCIVGPHGVEFARTLSGGGKEITARLAELYSIDAQKAEDHKRRAEFALEEQGDQQLSTAVQPLLRELRQTLVVHQALAHRSVKKIWLCGGGSVIPGFDKHIAQELDLEVERLRREHFQIPGIEAMITEDDEGGSWIKALGLSLHAHRGGRRGFLNLRRGPFSFRRDFDYLRGKIIQAAAWLVILAMLAIASALTRNLSLSATEKGVNGRIREVTRSAIGKAYDDPDVALSIMKEKTGPSADPLPKLSAVDILREIHARVPEGLQLKFKEINIGAKKVFVHGFTDSFESVEKIKAGMEKFNCFTNVQTGKTHKSQGDTDVDFELTIIVGC